jgi:hypothetical protein
MKTAKSTLKWRIKKGDKLLSANPSKNRLIFVAVIRIKLLLLLSDKICRIFNFILDRVPSDRHNNNKQTTKEIK